MKIGGYVSNRLIHNRDNRNLVDDLVLCRYLGFLWGLVIVKEQCIFQTLLLLHYWLMHHRGTILKRECKSFVLRDQLSLFTGNWGSRNFQMIYLHVLFQNFLPPMTIIFTYAESRLDHLLLKTSWYSNSLWFIGTGTRTNMHPMIRVLLPINPHQNDLDDVCDCRW